MAIMLMVLSFNVLGDALRDALDPHIRGGALVYFVRSHNLGEIRQVI